MAFILFPPVGDIISQKREERGMTRNALADVCGISRTEIIRIEEGQRKQPSLNNLRKISEALCIPYQTLLITAGYEPQDKESALSFYYPALKTEKQINTIERLISIISETPELSDVALDTIVQQAELQALASKHR